MTGNSDVAAYSIASKQITSSDGEEKTLLMVTVRGSYGAEWLSDFNLGSEAMSGSNDTDGGSDEATGASADGDASSGAGAASDSGSDSSTETGTEHYGFSKAADDVIDDLEQMIAELAAEDDDIVLLFCGHSRGGAIANLAAAHADEISQGDDALTSLDSIFAYTFATPTVTTYGTVDDDLYANIFNILNPSDIVPRFPLESWGYERYGTDIWLPSIDDDGFNAKYLLMQEMFYAVVGVTSPSVPSDKYEVDALIEKLSEAIDSPSDLVKPSSIWALVSGILRDVDIMQVLCSHYPSTHVAWLQATSEEDLTFE